MTRNPQYCSRKHLHITSLNPEHYNLKPLTRQPHFSTLNPQYFGPNPFGFLQRMDVARYAGAVWHELHVTCDGDVCRMCYTCPPLHLLRKTLALALPALNHPCQNFWGGNIGCLGTGVFNPLPNVGPFQIFFWEFGMTFVLVRCVGGGGGCVCLSVCAFVGV